MPDITAQGADALQINQPVCIHTLQITDCCLDKDCIEDLRVYLTEQSQAALQSATSTKVRSAELLFVDVSVEALAYKRGYYAVDLTFYYRIVGEALQGAMRPISIIGLSVFTKRTVLYGGKNKAKVFSSNDSCENISELNLPEAIAEALDPMVLSSKVLEVGECRCCETQLPEIPTCIASAFGEALVTTGEARRLYVSIGQFSTVRLERDTQLSVTAGEYCAPTRECCDDEGCEEDPCELFSRIDFPMQAFFPEGNCSCS
ncbi:MAG: hypothetical protein E7434_04090 [Ruminococcaceae bacterium]|nr:hypothetical protein [Oscillospiraceae bacterium]